MCLDSAFADRIFLDNTRVRVEFQKAMSRFFLQVYGCQMNQYEAGVVRDILERSGYTETSEEKNADVLLMLTCAVRSHAERRALGRLGTFRGLKDARRKTPDASSVIIGVLGCMSQNLRKNLAADHAADLIIGPDQYRRLPELIDKARETKVPQFALDQTEECYDDIIPGPSHPVRAFITVMRGCNNFCSYCIVPYTRGKERSKPLTRVLAEATALAGQGIKDITLLGQNVLAYHDQSNDFRELLEAVSEIPGIARIRFLTSHPKDLDEQVLSTIARIPKVCPALHLPIQSGSNRILKLMRRGYTREEYLAKIALAREYLPELNLTTDIMVGFPSETDSDFKDTLELVRTIGFDFAYMFRFSVRPGTQAVELGPKVSEAVAGQRLTRLIEVQNRITRERNSEMLNRTHELLIESPGPRQGMLGRTRTNRAVIVHSRLSIGQTVTCQVTRIQGWTPIAEVLGTEVPVPQ